MEDAIQRVDGVVGLAAIDLMSRREIRINAETTFPTASAIKTAVMVEAYHQAAENTLSMDESIALREADKVGGSGVLKGMTDGTALKVRDLVHLMIVLSDNTATNMLVARLGTSRIDARLEGYGLKRTKIFRPTFRDGRPDIHPDLEREYGLGMSTPLEMARLMALIAEGRVVNADASTAMLATLQAQNDRAMIPRHLPSEVRVGNKTGTDSEKLPDSNGRRGAIRTDAAIVIGDGVKYTLAIFVRRGGDSGAGVDNAGVVLGARLSKMVFDAFGGQSSR
ncbi:MAG TPA: serine hydrolase [Vicinamibacterales bacterium]|nr:serine hydrolase [Vicinamibacterales bacterium]